MIEDRNNIIQDKGLDEEKIGQGIILHIEDEYHNLLKVLVVPTPHLITSFTDLVVNPIQENALQTKDRSKPVIERPGAAERHAKLLTTLEEQGVELVYSRVTPIKEGHTPLFTRDVGVIIEDKVIPSRMRYEYRSIEVPGLIDNIDPNQIVQTDGGLHVRGRRYCTT